MRCHVGMLNQSLSLFCIENEFQEVGMIAGGSGMSVRYLHRYLPFAQPLPYSTPMYQVLQHALAEKDNKTKFTLIFANVTPADILLKEEFDAWKAKYPDTFNVIYTVDKAEGNWKGITYICICLSVHILTFVCHRRSCRIRE